MKTTRRNVITSGLAALLPSISYCNPIKSILDSKNHQEDDGIIVYEDGTIFDVEVPAGYQLTLCPKYCVPINTVQSYKISWGDGKVTSHVVHKTYTASDENPSHTYIEAGTYRISITNSFSNFSFCRLELQTGANSRITHIEKLGDLVSFSAIWRGGGWTYFAEKLSQLVSMGFKDIKIEQSNNAFSQCTKFMSYGDNGDLLANSLGTYLFNWTALEYIGNVPNAISISASFRSMTKLKYIGALPNIQTISNDSFWNTTSLNSTGPWPVAPPTAGNSNSIPQVGLILIPRGSYSAYASAQYWSNAISRLVEVDV